MGVSAQAYRAQLLYFVDDPAKVGDAAWQHFEDGVLWIENGCIKAVGSAEQLLHRLPSWVSLHHYPHHLITPGFIDTHVHYPQTEMIGAYGEKLLSWLSNYTFPVEARFSDSGYGRKVAAFFLEELLRNGTTTALVFGTVHPASVDAFFHEAQDRGLRMIAGKVMMDRNAPDDLCDSAETGYQESLGLIERWHNVDRLQYAVTPRFAPTSTRHQLEKAGQLLKEYPDLYLHTHLAESEEEVAWVKALFPSAHNYLDVYDREGLVGKRSIFAHGIHLGDEECNKLARSGAAVAHCPTSNLFLGSGLLDLQRLRECGVTVSLGTDVGAGTSFSLFRTMDEAYKIQQLLGGTLEPMQALYMATLGGAVALDLADRIGSFRAGNEADFVVLDLRATPLLAFRMQHCRTIQEKVFVLNVLADDRVVEQTFSAGRCVHYRDKVG